MIKINFQSPETGASLAIEDVFSYGAVHLMEEEEISHNFIVGLSFNTHSFITVNLK